MFLLVITGLFLILIVLIQRGRGGGLAGAFGGMGGQSAFGTKAGDLFTRVTIGVAAFWIILCAVSVKMLGSSQSKFATAPAGTTAEEVPGAAGGKAGETKPGASGEKAATGSTEKEPAADTPATGAPSETPAAVPGKSADPSPASSSPPAEDPAK